MAGPDVNTDEAVRCHNYDHKAIMCGDVASDMIRPVGGNAGSVGWTGRQLFGARIPVCKPCGENLVEDAELDWEFERRNLDPDELAQKANLPNAWGRYEEYDGIFEPETTDKENYE